MQHSWEKEPISFRGFTLLELLFVVSLLAVVSVFGLSAYRQRAVNTKTNEIVSTLQRILQAGSAFFIDKGQWPIAESSTGEAFEKNYLPVDLLVKNPWNLPYHYGPFSGHFSLDAKKSRLFQVETFIPSQAIAMQITAQLPNSILEKEGNLYRVEMQISMGGTFLDQDESSSRFIFKEIGFFNFKREKGESEKSWFIEIPFKCPIGMTHHVFVFLGVMHLDKGSWAGSYIGSAGVLRKNRKAGNKNQNDEGCDSDGCKLEVYIQDYQFLGSQEGARLEGWYMPYCEK